MATSTKRKDEGETQVIDLEKPLEEQAPETQDVLENLAAPKEAEAFTWDFSKISRNIPIPERVRKGPPVKTHPFVEGFDRMGHNDSFFLPTQYWLARGIKPENATKPQWQKQTIAGLFNSWRKKDPTREKLRVVTMAREENEDPEFPQHSGVRYWVVDATR